MSPVPPRPGGRKRRGARKQAPRRPSPPREAADPVVHTPVLRPPPPPPPPGPDPGHQEDSADCIRHAFDKTLRRFLETYEKGEDRQQQLLGQNARVVAQANADLLRLQQVFLKLLPGGSHGR